MQQQAKKGDRDFRLNAVYTIGILDFVFDEDRKTQTNGSMPSSISTASTLCPTPCASRCSSASSRSPRSPISPAKNCKATRTA
ncbi:hypothetical protein [Thiorhodovibrio winogradskyi]|uniref:hypothetical protein n=1 Tax=Thiorhodovibrio winogradskyi TaxID=77007 RepID=UPI002E2D32E2|nr:hypothetical protein [Thiorhodovibrio winogradskyi]